MRKAYIIGLIILLIFGAITLYVVKKSHKKQMSRESLNIQNSRQDSCRVNQIKTIVYCNSGFSGEMDVNQGETVTVINSSTITLDLESNPHPAHTDNPELNLGSLTPGQSKTFTVHTLGDWTYHNENKLSDTDILHVLDDNEDVED